MDKHGEASVCPVEAAIQAIGGKYRAVLLWHLIECALRYSELHKCVPRAIDKMLTQQPRGGGKRWIDKQEDISGCAA